VIEGATGEEDDRCEGKDAQGHPAPLAIGHGNEGQTSHQAEGTHHKMDHAPQFWGQNGHFGQMYAPRPSFELLHVSTIAQEG
jgi:hypothetical protein